MAAIKKTWKCLNSRSCKARSSELLWKISLYLNEMSKEFTLASKWAIPCPLSLAGSCVYLDCLAIRHQVKDAKIGRSHC